MIFNYLPRNEEDFALLTVLVRGEVEIIDRVPALVGRQARGEVVVGFVWAPELLHRHLLNLLIDLEHDESVVPLRFQLQELELAIIVHGHPRSRIGLHNIIVIEIANTQQRDSSITSFRNCTILLNSQIF